LGSCDHLWNDIEAGLAESSRSDLLEIWLPDPEAVDKWRPSIGKESGSHVDEKQES